MTRSPQERRQPRPALIRECMGCGLSQTVPPLAQGMSAFCARCSSVLHRARGHPIDHSIALTLAALVLLIVMCTTTLMSVQTAGIAHSADLFSGPAELVRRNMAELAAVVVFVTVLAPFGKLIGTLYVLLRLRESPPPRHLRRVFVLAERLRPWSMIEVFVLGVFVAYVKLGDLVHLTLDVVGLAEQDLRRFRRYIREPYGMVLVTGPTGSGKTTTLYAALNEIKSEEDKIITIEDPVEYQIRGITQIPVNEKKGLTFARGLRSILRHDPDKILVGEIRDAETAQIAINSALTGHLVFTTVHANNVVDVLGRFLNMGVEPYNFVSALNCILAQRLVRTICDFCRREVTYTDAELHPTFERLEREARTQLRRDGFACD